MSAGRRVYLVTQQDTNQVLSQVFGELDTILKEEERPYSTEVVAPENAGKLPIGPDDARFDASVTEFDYGSQSIRYLLTFLTWFGIGVSKLRVEGDLRSGDAAPRKLNLYSVYRMGRFGGSNENLMRYNAQSIAYNLARKITGRRILNVSVYQYALWSLILGLCGLIPMLGIIISPFGPGFGLAALILIFQRGLQKRRLMAVSGVALCAAGIVISCLFIAGLVLLGDTPG